MAHLPAELGAALRDARKAAGLNQLDVAGAGAGAALQQSRLSRIENGTAVPSDDELRLLARRYTLTDDRTAELLALAENARQGIKDVRLVVQRGQTLALQERHRRRETAAREVRAYQPAMILGALQSPRYAAVAMGAPVDSAEVTERGSRKLLQVEPGRRLIFIQTAASLATVLGSREIMAEQLDLLLEQSRQPAVELGVITADTAMPFAAPFAFHLYDAAEVVVGIHVAAATLTDHEALGEFRDLFDQLADLAVWGDEARAEIARIAGRYR